MEDHVSRQVRPVWWKVSTLLYLTAMRSLEMCGVTVWLSADLDLLVCIYPYLALLPIFTTSLQCEGSYS